MDSRTYHKNGERVNYIKFEETGVVLCGPFLAFWEQRGGREIFGIPVSVQVTEEIREGDMSFTTWVQYFENAIMEVGSDKQIRLRPIGKQIWERKQNQFTELLDKHRAFRYNLDKKLGTLP